MNPALYPTARGINHRCAASKLNRFRERVSCRCRSRSGSKIEYVLVRDSAFSPVMASSTRVKRK
jgi:hypothetical protein